VTNAPILAYNLSNGMISTIRNTSINDPDAICLDDFGNYYVSSFTENIVYRFENDFSSEPEIISTGHSEPSGMGFNNRDGILGVTNYNTNSIDLVQIFPNYIESIILYDFKEYFLSQNYPNPFNPSTKIRYDIPQRSYVTLKVYDVLGNKIETLVNDEKQIGTYTIKFDASSLPSGIYLYQLQTPSFAQTKKMILLR
jgi:hypothetical protein